MRRSSFYPVLTGLVILNAYLLSKPNPFGKIGIMVYKYYYLRTFPRTLLTVALVCGVALVLSELVQFLVRRSMLHRTVGMIVLILLFALSFVHLIKTGIDFSSWTYRHSGLRFRLGAFMLPTLVIGVFTCGLLKLPRRGESPDTAVEEAIKSLTEEQSKRVVQ